MRRLYWPVLAIRFVVTMLVAATPAFAAVEDGGCQAFAHTYLQSGLPSGFAASVTLDGVDSTPAVLTLLYLPYPSVQGRLSGPLGDGAGELVIDVEDGRLRAQVARDDSVVDVPILACSTGETVGLVLGEPAPTGDSDSFF
jgi:hypothetical protein